LQALPGTVGEILLEVATTVMVQAEALCRAHRRSGSETLVHCGLPRALVWHSLCCNDDDAAASAMPPAAFVKAQEFARFDPDQ